MSASAELGQDRLERYVVFDAIAEGGTATIHLARQLGAVGFSRIVAVKRLHPHYARNADFVAMMVDEALLAARIQHPNVVAVLDTVTRGGELFLVLEYIHGESLSRLQRSVGEGVAAPLPVALAIAIDFLHGLHAAHEALGEDGVSLGLVHRDVSPQNVLVGVDGRARILDFGVAKAASRMQTTEQGQIKGKFAYMAPEQLLGEPLDRRCDIFAAGIVVWELLTAHRLFRSDDTGVPFQRILFGEIDVPSKYVGTLSPELDALVMRALSRDRAARFPTALAMATALEGLALRASSAEVGAWVTAHATSLAERSRRLRVITDAAILPANDAKIAGNAAPNDVPTIVEQAPVVVDSAAADFVPEQKTPTRRRAAALVLFVTFFGVAGAGIAHWKGARASSAVIADGTSPQAGAAASTSAIASAQIADAASEVTTSAPAAVSPHVAHPSGTHVRATPHHANAQNPACNPAYDVGPDGVRRWKAQCLP